jgi:ABC-type branched-subunit amino acid transport system permease subunit
VTAYPDTRDEARSPRRARVLDLHATAEASVTVAFFPVLVAAPALFSRATVNDLGQADYLGLFAISFNILFKYSGLLSFGHAAFFGFAAYTQALSLQSFAGLPVPLLVLATGLSAAVLGYLIGQICVRRSGAYFSMTTLAIAASFYAVALARCDRRDGRAEQLHAAAA